MQKINIFNEVVGVRVPRMAVCRVFGRFLEMERVKRRFEVSVVFVGEKKMRELNEIWKGGEGATDVLSFNYGGEGLIKKNSKKKMTESEGGILGEIYICVKVAEKNARADGRSESDEILNLVAHGLLHLEGYTHETDKKYEIMMEKMKGIVGKK